MGVSSIPALGEPRDRCGEESARTVAGKLRFYHSLSFSTVLIRHIVGDHSLMLDSFRRLGADVIPQVRDL